MATSGIAIDKKLTEVYGKMQKNNPPHYCVLVFRITKDEKTVVLDEEASKTRADYESFSGDDKYVAIKKYICETAKEDDCFYFAVDCREKSDAKAGKKAETKPGFFIWAPDTAPLKKKMLISSTKETLKKKLEGIAEKNLHCSDFTDLNEKLDEHFQL